MVDYEKKRTLDEYTQILKKEVPYIDEETESHTIVTVTLQAIMRDFGFEKTNEMIDKFNLVSLGWSKVIK